MSLRKIQLASLSALVALAVTGCGGGGGDAPAADTATAAAPAPAPAPAPAEGSDKYVGIWVSCSVQGGTRSEREVATITKVDGAQFAVHFDLQSYPSTNCTGTASPVQVATAAATIVGAKSTTSSQPADKVNVTVTSCTGTDCPAAGAALKWIAAASTTQLLIGFDQQLDAEGYPNVFDSTYVKQ